MTVEVVYSDGSCCCGSSSSSSSASLSSISQSLASISASLASGSSSSGVSASLSASLSSLASVLSSSASSQASVSHLSSFSESLSSISASLSSLSSSSSVSESSFSASSLSSISQSLSSISQSLASLSAGSLASESLSSLSTSLQSVSQSLASMSAASVASTGSTGSRGSGSSCLPSTLYLHTCNFTGEGCDCWDCLDIPVINGEVNYFIPCGSSSGSGSSLSAGAGTIQTDCCPNLIPSTLYATISNTTGTCACLVGTYQMMYYPASKVWALGTYPPGSIPVNCSNNTSFDLELSCSAPFGTVGWYLDSQTLGSGQVAANGGGTCNPLYLVFNMSNNPNNPNATCSGTFTVTIKETP